MLFCLNTLATTLHWSKLYAMLSERLQATLYKKTSCAILSSYSRDNIVQVAPQSSIQYYLTSTRQHCINKILFNVVLILLGQYCTDKIFMQCCSKGSRQHCIKKKKKKVLINVVLILFRVHSTVKNSMQRRRKHSRQYCIRKTFCIMLS